MGESGIFSEDARVELIDGMIVVLSPIGSRHAWCVNVLTEFLMRLLGTEFAVWAQNPISIGAHSEPQPDITVLRRPSHLRRDRLPAPGDAVLIIEVADSSVLYDRSTKAPLYARAGIPEYWIVDLGAERIDVMSEPGPDGYRLVRSFRRGGVVSSVSLPSIRITVDEILGDP